MRVGTAERGGGKNGAAGAARVPQLGDRAMAGATRTVGALVL